ALTFESYQLLDLKQSRSRLILAAGFDTWHYYLTLQSLPKILHQPLHLSGQHRQQIAGISRPNGDPHVVANMFQQSTTVVVIVQDQTSLPVDARVKVFASQREFVQADNELIKQSLRRGRLPFLIHDSANLYLLLISVMKLLGPFTDDVPFGTEIRHELRNQTRFFCLPAKR